MKSLALVLGFCAAFCTRQTAAKGRLAVVVVVDQMRADELTGLATGWQAGFAQLLAQGEVHTHVQHSHGVLETASGHATLGTGELPCRHGVLDQRIFDRADGKLRGICDFKKGYSPAVQGACDASALTMETLGERLKHISPSSRVAAFSAKARSANLLAGQNADVVAWTFPHDGVPQVVGRNGARGSLPSWVAEAGQTTPVAQRWDLPRLPSALVRTDDRRAGIAAHLCRHGPTFPHIFGQPADLYTAQASPSSKAPALWSNNWGASWLCSPDSDRLVMDLAIASLSALGLGHRQTTDLLWISLGATDFVGHAFGYESQERAAILAAVDHQIGRLLGALVTHQGLGDHRAFDLQVILTSDHGIGPRLDTAMAMGLDAVGVARAPAQKAIAQALSGLTKRNDPFILRAPWVYLTEPDERAREIQADAVAEALRALPGIAQAYTAKALLSQSDNPQLTRLRASWTAQRGGDVAVLFSPGSRPVQAADDLSGAWHGGQSLWERHVPFVRWGSGIAALQQDRPTTIVACIGELRRWLGILSPSDEGRMDHEI